jgi:DNA invertase Pin-like site-specific DNA recombinase
MSSKQAAIGIVRVSVVGGRAEGDHFASPDEQRERIADLAEREGLHLADTFDELDVSGGKPLAKRAGLSQAIEAIEAGRASVLVVAYFDRLCRSLDVQREVVDRVEAVGGRVLAADVGQVSNGTAGKWLSATMLGMVAEYARRSGRERSIAGQEQAIKNGHAPVMLIPGLRRTETGAVEVDPATCSAVAEAFRLRAGGATVKAVREHLREHGIERSFHGTGSLLKSRQAIGTIVFGEHVMEVPALIDRPTWERVQRAAVPRGRKPKSQRLLARLGVLRCASCGSRMSVGSANNGRYPLYRCPPVGDCERRVTISAEVVEAAVVAEVRRLLDGIEGLATAQADLDRTAQEADAAERTYRAAVEALDPTEPAEVERLATFREARETARERYEHARSDANATSIAITAGDWDKLTLDEQRDLIRAVIERVEITRGQGAERISIVPKGASSTLLA